MRGWRKSCATAVAGLLLLPAGCADEAPPLSAKGCRAAWENLRQTQGENGSIAPEDSPVTDRWEQEYAVARRQAEHPSDRSACRDDVAAATERFERLVDLSVAVNDVDMGFRLAINERELRHAVRMRSYDPLPPRLARAFRVMRAQAPAVHEAVLEASQDAATVDLDDAGDVEALAKEITDAGRGAPGWEACERADQVIGRYELDEE